MDSLVQSCEQFEKYPCNLVQSEALSRNLRAFSERLQNTKYRLFCDHQKPTHRNVPAHGAVDFLDIYGNGQEPRSERVTDLKGLKRLLRLAFHPTSSDPLCRFIFIHAPHSRAPLSITENMFKFIFSYRQIMPSFLDFIFPFGDQINARDSYFSGLREESRHDARRHGLEIPELGRSGRELRLCYNLRSVEPSRSDPDLPWSIRQCAIYHSFDLQTGQAVWATVKGNQLIKERIETEEALSSLSGAKSLYERFSSSLATHLVFCDWSGENWRWYINDLEDKLQDVARGATAIPVDAPPTPPASPLHIYRSPTQRMGSFPFGSPLQSPISPKTRSSTFSSKFPSRSTTLAANSNTGLAGQDSCHNQDKWIKSGVVSAKPLRRSLQSLYNSIRSISVKDLYNGARVAQRPASPDNEKPRATASAPDDRPPPPELPPNLLEEGSELPHEWFNFGNLQLAQYIEAKLQDALLHLRLDVEVLEELRQYYQDIAAHKHFPKEVRTNCEADLARFDKCVLGVIKDLRMLQSRIETLLQLLANRKQLLNGILQHRSVKANESFSKKAQESAKVMEALTVEMHTIAKKTERETVSMRAITSVTLFFLPATFLASFMSTDILDFKDGKQDLQLKGLKVYLAIALPATLLTFFAWYIIYCVAKKTSESAIATADEDANSSNAV